MITTELERLLRKNVPFVLTAEQDIALRSLSHFIFSPHQNELFVLRGFAGTGKTSLVGALVKTLDLLQQRTVLLAPTGRAAKIFSLYAHHPAYTIHKKVYRQKSFADGSGEFSLNFNSHQHTLFLVDEASMIANEGLSGAIFGTGRVLDDLITYVYGGQGCRMLLLGDTAQLPPVGQLKSPALSIEVLSSYHLLVREAELTQVMRQTEHSGVLWNATRLRQLISQQEFFGMPKVRLHSFADIKIVTGSELIEELESAFSKVGLDQTIVITRSNKRANLYNNGIRNRILGRDEELTSGDRLLIAKNNYFWLHKAQQEVSDTDKHTVTKINTTDFIANGDTAVVRRVRRVRELYGFRFADVTLQLPDYEECEIESSVMLDCLQTEAPALTKEQGESLYNSVLEDYADIPLKKDRMKALKNDAHYNALQIKYAYAITCHKAQGGQWQSVFLDQGYMTEENLTPEYFRWLYTAFTRATETLYLINWPKEQLE